MPRPNLTPIDITTAAKGALQELFEANINKVVENICDSSTPAEAARTITIKLKLKPSGDRRSITLVTSASCSLAPISEHVSRVYLGKDGNNKGYLFAEDPRQDILFTPPEADANVLDFKQPNTSN